MVKRAERWPGGYVRRDAKGRPVYVIYRRVQTRLFEVSTRTHSLKIAMRHLERFEEDPSTYDPSGLGPNPIYISAELAQEYLEWARDYSGNSTEWLRKKQRYLAWWADHLRGRDLRTVSLRDHIRPPLKDATSPHHRTATLKAFYAWLRTEKNLITPAEDPTFGALKVPQLAAAQLTEVKAIERERYLAARSHLVGVYRDALDVLAATGWHVTELMRFARGGRVGPLARPRYGIAGALICPRTKSGEPLRVAVGEEAYEAGKRILAHGPISREWFDRAIRGACEAAGIEAFTPGVMRHSVATWAIDEGADPASVAAFLNHKSQRTTRRFYATHATPKKVPTML